MSIAPDEAAAPSEGSRACPALPCPVPYSRNRNCRINSRENKLRSLGNGKGLAASTARSTASS